MAGLRVRFNKFYNIPVAPGDIQPGELSITPVVVIAGDFSTTGSIIARTFTMDLKGIALTDAQAIVTDCEANMESLLLGVVDLQTSAGLIGGISWRGYTIFPVEATESGGLQVGSGTEETLPSFPVKFLTGNLVGKIG